MKIGTVVEHTPHAQEIMSSNPVGCWTLFLLLSLSHLSCVSFNSSLVEMQHNWFSIKDAQWYSLGRTKLNVLEISKKIFWNDKKIFIASFKSSWGWVVAPITRCEALFTFNPGFSLQKKKSLENVSVSWVAEWHSGTVVLNIRREPFWHYFESLHSMFVEFYCPQLAVVALLRIAWTDATTYKIHSY